MYHRCLQDFIDFLDSRQHIKRINLEVSANLEITEISKRFLAKNGPALIFENVLTVQGTKSEYTLLSNLFANKDRVAWGLGLEKFSDLKDLGKLLAFFQSPSPPKSFKEIISLFPLAKRVLSMSNKIVKYAPSQEVVVNTNLDINAFPIQKCWPKDVSSLITWPLVITKNPKTENTSKEDENFNVGIYRLQVVDRKTLIVRWLKLRGGAGHYQIWKNKNISKMPVAVVIGGPPALILSATMPLPQNMSEYSFASLIQNKAIELVQCRTIDLKVPANAEIIIEGEIDLDKNSYLEEGPFGDHTGYYNDKDLFPILNIKAITMKKKPIYLSTYTGRPLDEPSILAQALNEIFIPIVQKQFPEITDLFLPPEGCSYRVVIVSINKTFQGQGVKIMMGIMSFLNQFLYSKILIVVDSDINIRDWKDVIWAISTRADPVRDTKLIDNSPIDYLDFASPVEGLGGKMFIDATNKIGNETSRKWGKKIHMSKEVISKIDKIWNIIGI